MSLLTPQRPADGAHTHSAATMVPDQSRAERTTSFDVSDFPVPHGREEDWRFTPVDRLGAFFRDEATGGSLAQEHVLPEGVTVSTISAAEWRALGVPAPQDRAAAVAAAHSDGVTVVDVPAEAELTEPVRIRLTGTGPGLVHEHLARPRRPLRRATVVVEHHGVRRLLRGPHGPRGRRLRRHRRLRAGVGRRVPPPRASTTSSSAGTPGPATSPSPSVAASSG